MGGPWSFQMMQPGTQLLAVTADHPIVGVNRRYGASESAGMGAYRLKYRSGVTSCVPYHATAEELQAALNRRSYSLAPQTAWHRFSRGTFCMMCVGRALHDPGRGQRDGLPHGSSP